MPLQRLMFALGGRKKMRTPDERRAKIADCLRRRKIRLKSIHICQDCGMRPPFEDKTFVWNV